jgi:hypothetical protein
MRRSAVLAAVVQVTTPRSAALRRQERGAVVTDELDEAK